MKLYYAPGTCSLAPHIVLREAGLAFDLQRVDIKTKEMEGGGNFLEINPKGYVPVLRMDDGALLTEVTTVLQYIADQQPSSGLVPAAGTMERYRQQEWLAFINSELHKGFSPLWKPATPDEYKAQAKALLGVRFDYLQQQLQGKTWLEGDRYTAADAYLFTILSWGKWVGVDLSPWPTLTEYVARVAARPAVREALKAEGLLK